MDNSNIGGSVTTASATLSSKKSVSITQASNGYIIYVDQNGGVYKHDSFVAMSKDDVMTILQANL